MTKPHIKRPTAEEISAVLSPSTETEFVELQKPTYDYLKSNLPNDDAVSAYVSNRITSELVRLSKMRSDGAVSHWAMTSPEKRAENARKRWDGVAKRDCVRVRVWDDAYAAYLALSANPLDRTTAAGELVLSGCDSVRSEDIAAHCESHKAKAARFISLPDRAVGAAKTAATALSVPFSRIISYLIAKR